MSGRTLVAAAMLLGAIVIGRPAGGGHADGRLLIVGQPFTRSDAVWMAASHGYFREEGLAVTVQWVASGKEALTVFQSGPPVGGAAFVIVSEALALDFWRGGERDFAVIAPLARDGESWVAIAKADVTSAEALRNRRVGVQLGSTSAWFLSEYLRAHGLSERDLALKDVPADGGGFNPGGSELAAVILREPHASALVREHGDAVRRLATARGYAHGYLLLGTSRSYLREHSGVAERLLRALDRGRRHAADNPGDVLAFARAMFGEDTTNVERDYAATERLLAFDRVALDDLAKLARWMKDAGLLAPAADVSALLEPAPLHAVFPDRVTGELRR